MYNELFMTTCAKLKLHYHSPLVTIFLSLRCDMRSVSRTITAYVQHTKHFISLIVLLLKHIKAMVPNV